MSFLDSVLSSIGTGGSTPSPNVVPIKKPTSLGNPSIKRKAEDELDSDIGKSAKIERTYPPKIRDRPSKSPQPNIPNGGANAKPTVATPVPASAPSSKNPKKGSFAAIMAKAKEAQAEPAKITGTITHKPKEKSRSRKDLIMEREEAKKAAKKGVPLKGPQNSKDAVNVKKGSVEEKPTGTTKSGYQGTMKPAKPGYQGTVKPSSTSAHAGAPRSGYTGTAARGKSSSSGIGSKQTPGRRRIEYDESDDYGSEDQDGAESDDLSDMDAGFDAMEEEEEEAERIARREDRAAQAELDRLKREKDRKKALYAKNR